MVATEMLGILRSEKRALMMVEPPGEQRRTGIFEIHDGVFVAVENAVFERLRSFMRHPGVHKLGIGVDAFAVKAGEHSGRGRSVEALIVKTKAKLHFCLPSLRVRRAIKESQ